LKMGWKICERIRNLIIFNKYALYHLDIHERKFGYSQHFSNKIPKAIFCPIFVIKH
jgi:hypothetical protein